MAVIFDPVKNKIPFSALVESVGVQTGFRGAQFRTEIRRSAPQTSAAKIQHLLEKTVICQLAWDDMGP
jgi:hypothetical protein